MLHRLALAAAATTTLAAAMPADAIVIRADLDQSLYAAYAQQYPAVGQVRTNAGDIVSGTLVAPRFVLGAAHTVPGRTNFVVGGNTYQIVNSYVNPDWNRLNPGVIDSEDYEAGGDLAVFELDRAVTNVTPIPYYTGSSERGVTADLVGFGQTGNGNTGRSGGRGTKLAGTNVVDNFGGEVTSSEVNLDLGDFASTIMFSDFDTPETRPLDDDGDRSPMGSIIPTTLEAQTGGGDSGGPMIYDFGDGPVVIGVASFIAAYDQTNAANSDYGDIQGHTRVGQYSEFLNSVVAIPSPTAAVGGIAMLGSLLLGRRRR